MAQIILFGGGDGGGIYIDDRGVHRIPPFTPDILLQLRGLSAFVNGAAHASEKVRSQLSPLTAKVGSIVVDQVGAIAGRIEGDSALVYLDGDDGFVCGSTGKVPIPLPKPHAGLIGSLIGQV